MQRLCNIRMAGMDGAFSSRPAMKNSKVFLTASTKIASLPRGWLPSQYRQVQRAVLETDS